MTKIQELATKYIARPFGRKLIKIQNYLIDKHPFKTLAITFAVSIGLLLYSFIPRFIEYERTRNHLEKLADTNQDNIIDERERAELWKRMGNNAPYSGQSLEEIFAYQETLFDMPVKETHIRKAIGEYKNDTNFPANNR